MTDSINNNCLIHRSTSKDRSSYLYCLTTTNIWIICIDEHCGIMMGTRNASVTETSIRTRVSCSDNVSFSFQTSKYDYIPIYNDSKDRNAHNDTKRSSFLVSLNPTRELHLHHNERIEACIHSFDFLVAVVREEPSLFCLPLTFSCRDLPKTIFLAIFSKHSQRFDKTYIHTQRASVLFSATVRLLFSAWKLGAKEREEKERLLLLLAVEFDKRSVVNKNGSLCGNDHPVRDAGGKLAVLLLLLFFGKRAL